MSWRSEKPADLPISEESRDLWERLERLHHELRDYTAMEWDRINHFYENLFSWSEKGEFTTGNDVTIILVGGGERSVPAVKSLVERPDVKIHYYLIQKGRSDEKTVYPTLQELATDAGIEYDLHPSGESLSDEQIDKLQSFSGDAIIGSGIWRAYLPERVWEATEYGFIANHGSLLPEYRGWANINWYMINGESEYGLQAFQLSNDIDAGKLVYDEQDGTPLNVTIEIDEEMYISDLQTEVRRKHAEQINDIIDLLKRDTITFIKQDESSATYCCHRGPEDGEIDWGDGTREIYNFVRAQADPYPGAYSYYNNEKFKILRADIPEDMDDYVGRIPGKIVERNADGTVDVLTGDGVLRIEEITVGKQKEPKTFLDSVRNTLGYDAQSRSQELESKLEELTEKVKTN